MQNTIENIIDTTVIESTVTYTQTDNINNTNPQPKKDTRSRKYLMVINNPLDKGFTHDKIKEKLNERDGLVYYCMSDEIGEQGTPHTHIYVVFKSPVRFSTLLESFDKQGHFEKPKGNSESNRAYVEKSGKWKDTEKASTSVAGTFEEWGELPIERPGSRSDLHYLYERIKDGASNSEILQENP